MPASTVPNFVINQTMHALSTLCMYSIEIGDNTQTWNSMIAVIYMHEIVTLTLLYI